MGKHCMIGLDYEESCNESGCPLVQMCKRSFYERNNCNKDTGGNQSNWYWIFSIF